MPDLVWDDWRLVHDDVHEVENVCPALEVQQHRGVPVDDAALGEDLDGDLHRGGHDLGRQLDADSDLSLLDLEKA